MIAEKRNLLFYFTGQEGVDVVCKLALQKRRSPF